METTATASWRRLLLGAVAVLILSAAFAQAASARTAYVASYYSDAVYAVDAATNAPIGAPISTGAESGPYTLAISPDGRTVWVVNYKSGTLISIDTATNQVVGAPILIPEDAYPIAITPDGSRAYIGDPDDDGVVAVDLLTRQVLGGVIHTGGGADGVSITPDGRFAYVSNYDDGTISVIDIAANQVVGSPIPGGESPYYSALTPNGGTLFVADTEGFVRTVNLASRLPGPSITAGEDTTDVAVTPNGARVYAVNYDTDSATVIDAATLQTVGAPIQVSDKPEFVTVTPDGRRALVANWAEPKVLAIDTALNQAVGPSAPIGEGSGTVEVVPDQSPTAAFAFGRARPGAPLELNASTSTDPDGAVAGFAWLFGDGQSNTVATPIASHKYSKPGSYAVTLTVTDNEGCSVALVFTGQTASCHGNPAATLTQVVKVVYPGVKVRCPSSADGSCRIKLKAVTRKKGKLKAESKVALAKVKPGKSKVVSLKPRKAFAKKLAKANKVLVQQIVKVDGKTTTKLKRLKVVR